jgi:hypothetical protein
MAFPDFMNPDLPAKERAGSLMGHAAGLTGAAAIIKRNPALATLGATLGLLAYMNRLHGEGNGTPVQQDDFGNYYGPGAVTRDAETDRRVDEMTDRVINAGWY